MGHHLGNASTSGMERALQRSDLPPHEAVPKNFVGVAQLPQSPGAPIDSSVRELVRCVEELGSSAATNPDTSEVSPMDRASRISIGTRSTRDVRAARARDDPRQRGLQPPYFQTTGSYYLAADTVAFMQMMTSDLFKDFPDLKLIIHGGGAVLVASLGAAAWPIC